jgi:hypothetical protein
VHGQCRRSQRRGVPPWLCPEAPHQRYSPPCRCSVLRAPYRQPPTAPRRLLHPHRRCVHPGSSWPAGTDAGTCCVRKPAGYCVAAVTRADCDAADSCRWGATTTGLPSPRCGAAIEATTANGFLQAGRSPTPFRCAQAASHFMIRTEDEINRIVGEYQSPIRFGSHHEICGPHRCAQAVSAGFCAGVIKLGASCEWRVVGAGGGAAAPQQQQGVAGACVSAVASSHRVTACGRNQNSNECTLEVHRPASGIPGCVWDDHACLNQCPGAGTPAFPFLAVHCG